MKSGPNVELEVGTEWPYGAKEGCYCTGGVPQDNISGTHLCSPTFWGKALLLWTSQCHQLCPRADRIRGGTILWISTPVLIFTNMFTPLQNHASALSHGLWASQGCCRSCLPAAGYAGRVTVGQGWPGSLSHPPDCELIALISLPEGL